MQIQLDIGEHQLHIKRYEGGTVTINQTDYRHPIAFSKEQFIDLTLPSSPDDFDIKTLESIFQFEPEIILLGCGSSPRFLSIELETFCQQKNRTIDSMTTSAACRTFTILAAERRNVIAILYP